MTLVAQLKWSEPTPNEIVQLECLHTHRRTGKGILGGTENDSRHVPYMLTTFYARTNVTFDTR